jgi:DNA recombination protein RmuC
VSAELLLELLVAFLAGVGFCAAVLRGRYRRTLARLVDAALSEERALSRIHGAELNERLLARQREIEQLRDEQREARTATERIRDELLAAREAVARSDSAFKEASQRLTEQSSFFEQARETLNIQFRTLASEILEEKGRHLSEVHRGELGLVLGPLSERLASFQKKVEDIYVSEGEKRFSLFQEVQKLQEASVRLSEDASNLTRALKGEAKTRGNWGEVMLEAILERSGLVKGSEYQTQMTLASEDGRRRPDVVIRLPDAKHIVVDSKVSLVAYDRYYAADDDAGREVALKEHVDSVRRHVNDLGRKEYQNHDQVNSPDFVVMFVPIEPAFNLAASADANLIFDAFDKKVVIVTPGTLLAMLSTVATLWRREQQTANALEIARRAGEIHDKFVTAIEHFDKVGTALESAQETFRRARGSFSDGRGNVIKRLNDLRKLGIKTGKALPADLLAEAGVDRVEDDDEAAEPQGVEAVHQPDLLEQFKVLPGDDEANAA